MRLNAAANGALCAVVLSLAALGHGCVRSAEAVAKCVDDLTQRLAERRGFPGKTLKSRER